MIALELFYTFFKIGLFTFGGGYAMLPLIQDEAIKHGWLSMEELVDFVAVSESTPGPFAINIATYVGAETAGVLGSLCATFGVVLPSFIVILIVARFYLRFRNSRTVSSVMYGLRPAVVGLLASAVWGMLPTVFFHSGFSWDRFAKPEFLCAAGIFGVMVVPAVKKVNPIIIIVCSAALGILLGFLVL